MERRKRAEERRRSTDAAAGTERRSKSRRKARAFVGTPRSQLDEIEVNEADDVSYWAKQLGVAPDELLSAVKQVGSSVKAVRAHLGK